MMVSERRDAYLETIAQLTRERAAAKQMIGTLRGRDVWQSDIPQEWRTAGFVQELTATASFILETDPKESLSLAQLALAIATSIPSDAYPAPIQAQIEGSAWKEIGTAHRYTNKYEASLRAYDAAERAFRSANSLVLDEAIAKFARAIVFGELQRYDEALQLLPACEAIFESFGDRKHLIQAKMLKGNICAYTQRWREARAIYESALPQVPGNDFHTRSALHQNLGNALTELRDFDEALMNLHAARQIFDAERMPIECNRCEWNIARLLLQKGEYENALEILQRVRALFLEKGMPEDAGLAGLDAADAAIAIGETPRARELVSGILAEFTAANLSMHAVRALAYLRDVLPQTSTPANAVRHVRHYLDRLQKEPSLLFLPLPE